MVGLDFSAASLVEAPRLVERGFEITGFEEHDSVPWEAIYEAMDPHPDHPGEWRLRDRPWRLPHSYTLQATHRG